MTTILLIAIAVLQAADIYTTHRILAAGGRETNRFVDALLRAVGVLPGLLAVKAVFLSVLCYIALLPLTPADTKMLNVFFVAIVGLYGWVVIHNFKQMKGRP